ncbi:MAG: hypothetical protein AB7U25_11940 [Vicinamibacterales bacterium]
MRRAPALPLLALAFALVLWPRSGVAQDGAAPLLRVFLIDGTALTSFGEWARLDDTVVLSLPLSTAAAPELQLVTLPASRVDWPRTERYAAAARAVHYASTRAEDDYAIFSNQVASALTGIAREPDPARRLAMAEQARKAMAEWPGQHHGYRATDVQQMLTLLDEIVGELRAAAGQDSFELELRAATPPPPAETLLPPPTPADLAAQLLAASTLAAPAERTTLLQRLVAFIDRAAGMLPQSWAASVRSRALGTLAEDRATDAAYAKLTGTALAAATRLAREADVRAIERLRTRALADDRELGGKRPAAIAALVAALDADAAAARRLRLARDQWRLLAPQYRSYRRAVQPVLRELERAAEPLEDIRHQAGPAPSILKRVMARFYKVRPAMKGTTPPTALASPHALLESAWDLADSAVTLRLRAVETGDPTRAAEASAAAAGALMVMARAREDLDKALAPPTLP